MLCVKVGFGLALLRNGNQLLDMSFRIRVNPRPVDETHMGETNTMMDAAVVMLFKTTEPCLSDGNVL